jgi:hypothetical protein
LTANFEHVNNLSQRDFQHTAHPPSGDNDVTADPGHLVAGVDFGTHDRYQNAYGQRPEKEHMAP